MQIRDMVEVLTQLNAQREAAPSIETQTVRSPHKAQTGEDIGDVVPPKDQQYHIQTCKQRYCAFR
jgi:hypothetical protein